MYTFVTGFKTFFISYRSYLHPLHLFTSFRLTIFSVTVLRHMKVYMLWDNSKKYGGFSIMEVTSQSSEFKYFRFLLNLNTQKYIYT